MIRSYCKKNKAALLHISEYHLNPFTHSYYDQIFLVECCFFICVDEHETYKKASTWHYRMHVRIKLYSIIETGVLKPSTNYRSVLAKAHV